MTSETQKTQRRRPRQARSRATWEAIVEAAAQILERRGPDGFNTNEVAERAGVSIGTLYQYFPDKRAILVEVARRELASVAAPLPSRHRALLQALIAMLEGFGRLGAGVADGRKVAPRSASDAAPTSRRGETWKRQALDLIEDWLSPLLTPRPLALRPIPVRRRIPE